MNHSAQPLVPEAPARVLRAPVEPVLKEDLRCPGGKRRLGLDLRYQHLSGVPTG